MRFEQDAACRGTHCATAPLPALPPQLEQPEKGPRQQRDQEAPRPASTLGPEQERLHPPRPAGELGALEEPAKPLPRPEPGMAYPAPAPAGPGQQASNGRLPAPAAPRPTDFSVSTLLTAAGSSSQSSGSPPPGGPGSPAAAPETPPLLGQGQRSDLSHAAAASYFNAAALAAAGFYGHGVHPHSGSPGHHLQGKGLLGAHHHPQLSSPGIGPPGWYSVQPARDEH